MIIRVDVRIDNEPGDTQYYSGGNGLSFSESAKFSNANFETVSNVFTRCHALLETLKYEDSITARGQKKP